MIISKNFALEKKEFRENIETKNHDYSLKTFPHSSLIFPYLSSENNDASVHSSEILKTTKLHLRYYVVFFFYDQNG